MYKYILAFTVLFGLSGCTTHFAINGMMCDKIAADPFSTIPAECRNYVEVEAEKASKINTNLVAPDDLLIFKK